MRKAVVGIFLLLSSCTTVVKEHPTTYPLNTAVILPRSIPLDPFLDPDTKNRVWIGPGVERGVGWTSDGDSVEGLLFNAALEWRVSPSVGVGGSIAFSEANNTVTERSSLGLSDLYVRWRVINGEVYELLLLPRVSMGTAVSREKWCTERIYTWLSRTCSQEISSEAEVIVTQPSLALINRFFLSDRKTISIVPQLHSTRVKGRDRWDLSAKSISVRAWSWSGWVYYAWHPFSQQENLQLQLGAGAAQAKSFLADREKKRLYPLGDLNFKYGF